MANVDKKPPVALIERPWGSFKQYAHNKNVTVSLMSVRDFETRSWRKFRWVRHGPPELRGVRHPKIVDGPVEWSVLQQPPGEKWHDYFVTLARLP